MDIILKYLWKNSVTKKWFNEIILEKVGVDLTDYVLVDGEFNFGSSVKDFRTDLTFSDMKQDLMKEKLFELKKVKLLELMNELLKLLKIH